jgi:isopenicillin N synthase-like dioxygenase
MTVPTKPLSESAFNIPTVDRTPYLNSPSSTEALKIVDQVRTACLTTGFFQLVGHGIPRSLQDEVFKGSEAFFSLPLEEKKKLDKSVSEGASNRGYELIGNQGLQVGTLPDLKEVSLLVPRQSSRGLTRIYRVSTSAKKSQPPTPESRGKPF